MIGHLIVIAIGAAFVGGQASKRSGKVWAYLAAAGLAVLAASLVIISILLFLRPDYAPLPDGLGKIRGIASIVIGLLTFFHSIGPKGTGLILGGFGLFVIRAFRGQLALIRRGVYVGMDELDKQTEYFAKQTEYLASAAKLKALSEANEGDSKWIDAQKDKTFPSEEEAEKAASAINAMIKRRSARWQEMRVLVARARTLEPALGIQSSAAKQAPNAAA